MTDLKLGRGFALPLDLVTEATAIVATRGAGKSSTSAVIVEEGFAAGVQTVVIDRTGVYWGLRSNAAGDGPGLPIYVLGGPHGDVPLEHTAGHLIADLVVDSGHSFVLDLSDFSKAGMAKFTADFLERMYDRKARARTTLLLVIDEAHQYAPQTPRGGFKGDSARLMGAMEDVVGLGRSRGIGVVLTTQRTQALNKAVLDLIETLLVMRMLSPRAREAVRLWIHEKHEEDELGIIASLDSLPTGTAWVWSPLRGILDKVAVRRIKTFDSYATPKPGERRVEPTKRRELDLAALGKQMQASVERAKENDPGELRRRVKELERELAKKPAAGETQVVERIEIPVEVPVLDDETVERLASLVGEIRDVAQALAPLRAVADQIATAVRGATSRPAPVRTPPRPQPQAPPARPPRRESSAVPGTADQVPGPQQKILDALGWYEALGVAAPTRVQVGLIAGYSYSSGNFANLLGKLSTAGLVGYPSPGCVALTDEGRALATDPGLPGDDEGVQAEVMRRIPAPQAKLLAVLIERWPDAITREELGEITGYSHTSGNFANLLGKLKTSALISYPDKGHARAEDVLFPMAVR